jgi:hypothetical protein
VVWPHVRPIFVGGNGERDVADPARNRDRFAASDRIALAGILREGGRPRSEGQICRGVPSVSSGRHTKGREDQ